MTRNESDTKTKPSSSHSAKWQPAQRRKRNLIKKQAQPLPRQGRWNKRVDEQSTNQLRSSANLDKLDELPESTQVSQVDDLSKPDSNPRYDATLTPTIVNTYEVNTAMASTPKNNHVSSSNDKNAPPTRGHSPSRSAQKLQTVDGIVAGELHLVAPKCSPFATGSQATLQCTNHNRSHRQENMMAVSAVSPEVPSQSLGIPKINTCPASHSEQPPIPSAKHII